MNQTKLAFIGTGHMGAPMAHRLLDAGFPLAVWNRSADKLKPLVDAGARACATPREAVADADVVMLCLTGAAANEALMFGEGGVASSLRPGATVVDFATIGVEPARDFAARLARDYAADWLDCPVSGGVAGAEAGTLAIMAGGAPEVLERVRPVLAPLSSRVTLMGGAGAGQAAKLCNQLIVTANLLAVAEAMALGEALGVDVAQLPAALKGGFADSIPLQIFGPRMAQAEDPGPAVAAVATMVKDLTAIRAAADTEGAAIPLCGAVADLYGRVIEAGLGAEDLPVLMRLYRSPALLETGGH